MNFTSSFLKGFFCTLLLFIICYVIVVGVLVIRNSLSNLFVKEQPMPESKKRTRKTKPVSDQTKPIRSIEIDPDQIDKILVKKSS